MKKSQIALEFLLVTAGLVFFLTLFAGIITEKTLDKNKEKELLLAKNLALSVQDEINLASQSTDGYRRNFSVPANILGDEFTIRIVSDYVYINTSRLGVSYPVKKINGSILQGNNFIRKQNGEIYLN